MRINQKYIFKEIPSVNSYLTTASNGIANGMFKKFDRKENIEAKYSILLLPLSSLDFYSKKNNKLVKN